LKVNVFSIKLFNKRQERGLLKKFKEDIMILKKAKKPEVL